MIFIFSETDSSLWTSYDDQSSEYESDDCDAEMSQLESQLELIQEQISQTDSEKEAARLDDTLVNLENTDFDNYEPEINYNHEAEVELEHFQHSIEHHNESRVRFVNGLSKEAHPCLILVISPRIK